MSGKTLITGYSEQLASLICHEILAREKKARVFLLVRSKKIKAAERLLSKLPASQAERVSLFEGDVRSLDLGLSGVEYKKLVSQVDRIFHVSRSEDYSLDRAQLFEINFTGTGNVLALARECPQLERFVHFSSIYVSGELKGVIDEEEFFHKPRFRNAVEESFHAAEKLVRGSMRKLPVTIFRLGTVVGDSKTGEFFSFKGPYRILQLMLSLERGIPLVFPGKCNGMANLVPVDYVKDAVLHIVELPGSEGTTYQLTDPYPMTARQVLEAMAAYIGRKPPRFGLPTMLFGTVLKIPRLAKLSGIPRELLDYFNQKAIHNTSRTLSDLKGAGISCPRFESYFPLNLEYARQRIKQRRDLREEQELVDPLDWS